MFGGPDTAVSQRRTNGAIRSRLSAREPSGDASLGVQEPSRKPVRATIPFTLRIRTGALRLGFRSVAFPHRVANADAALRARRSLPDPLIRTAVHDDRVCAATHGELVAPAGKRTTGATRLRSSLWRVSTRRAQSGGETLRAINAGLGPTTRGGPSAVVLATVDTPTHSFSRCSGGPSRRSFRQ